MTTEQFENSQRYSGFTRIDSADDPGRYFSYLERVTKLLPIVEYKRISHEMLQIKQGDQVLDAGCGIGTDVMSIATNYSAVCAVVGIDKSSAMIAEARRRTPEELLDNRKVQFRDGDIENMLFKNGIFDSARSDRTFQYFPHPEDALAELIRVVKPNGNIVISEPDWESLSFTGLSDESSEAIRRTFLSIIVNPTIGRDIAKLFSSKGIGDIIKVVVPLRFEGTEQVDEILLLKTSLERAVRSGVL